MPQSNSKLRDDLTALAVAAATIVLYVVSFPFAFVSGKVLCVPEAGYIFLAPLAVWLMRPRKLLATAVMTIGTFWFGWTVLIFWLRHVTVGGTIGLSGVLALFSLCWALVARKALPWLDTRKARERVVILAGLAALWIILEWVRSWIFSGFPWLPVAASQWCRPVMLQILPFTGYLGLSWVLLFFNLSLASYAVSFLNPENRKNGGFVRPNIEIYFALFFIIVCMAGFLAMRSRNADEDLFYAGIVQPYAPGLLKWDPKVAQDNLVHLSKLSDDASRHGAQVVFWPEASTPWPVVAPEGTMREWADQMSSMIALPIVMGNMAEIANSKGENTFYNGVFVDDPVKGLSDTFYAKRHLVPFGEYNPLAFITDNFIDLPYNFFTPGKDVTVLSFTVPGGGTYKFGSLLCYEDVFPKLARDEVKEGADFLFVATNNAWYGEEAGAYQHAVHSVLRAVENRRPVLRCGNGGWSGLIDEYGVIRHVSERTDKGVYFMGSDVFTVTRDPEWKGVTTFYTRMGDWVVIVALLLVLRMGSIIMMSPAQARQPPAEPVAEKKTARSFAQGDRPRIGRRSGGEKKP